MSSITKSDTRMGLLWAKSKGGRLVATFVDEALLPELEQYKWRLTTKGYVYRAGIASRPGESWKDTLYLHRLLLNVKAPYESDHINRNTLDNRLCNLRIATRQQQTQNMIQRKNNEYTGVQVERRKKSPVWYRAYINGFHIGFFDTIEEAALARDCAAIQLHGEFAVLNFPEVFISSRIG